MDIICTEVNLPYDPATQVKAYRIAMHENLRNIPESVIADPVSLALVRKKIHRIGRTLTVKFLNGSDKQKSKVQAIVKEWEKHANIKFSFVTDQSQPGDIRIAFKWNNDGGSWSYIGTDNLYLGNRQNEPTMNFGWLTDNADDDEYKRVVLHEFGHALGCIHEHQNPAVAIPWDKEKVYEYYRRTQGWDKETVDINIFRKYSEEITQFSRFDKDSIMLYPIDNDLTVGDFEIGMNRDLSSMDKQFIGVCYPMPVAPPVEPTEPTEPPTEPTAPQFPILRYNKPIESRLGKWMEEDYYQFEIVNPETVMIETQGFTDTVMSLIRDSDKTVIAWDDDTGKLRNAQIVKALSKGKYIVRIRHYSDKGTGNYKVILKQVV